MTCARFQLTVTEKMRGGFWALSTNGPLLEGSAYQFSRGLMAKKADQCEGNKQHTDERSRSMILETAVISVYNPSNCFFMALNSSWVIAPISRSCLNLRISSATEAGADATG